MLIKRLNKSKSLRMVNLLGLTTIFSSLLLSFAFIKKELSYDRFHEKADRIIRFSTQWDNEPIDGRNTGFSKNSPYVNGVSGIEDMVLIDKVNAGIVTYNTTPLIINDFYFATANFFEVFSFPLLEGESKSIIDTPGKVAISKKMATRLFGDASPIGKEIRLSGRKFNQRTVFISGVFADFPATSHFHTDLVVHRADNEESDWAYTYLLLDNKASLNTVKQGITQKMDESNTNSQYKASPYFMPLTDIHLHSHLLRELETNGNITYIYLIASANFLLLIIVLFNLWLNSGLIFSFNRKYYQLLRLNGASSAIVLRDESLMAILLGGLSIFAGVLLSASLAPRLNIMLDLSQMEYTGLCFSFLFIVVLVSVFPVLTQMPSTLFRYDKNEPALSGFSLSKVKYMLIIQYCIVMFVVILGFGINKQMRFIASSQVGGEENAILVMKEQPEIIKQRYEILKTELLKHPEIEEVTSAMQLPGSAIRDGIQVQIEGENKDNFRRIPILVVGDDFLPFFRITPLTGNVFRDNPLSYQEEEQLFNNFIETNNASNITEEYIINRRALQELGFTEPQDALNKIINIKHGGLDYINKGRIIGVTEDYNYTTTFEDSQPQMLMQRKNFQHCIMVRLSSAETEKAISLFNQIWNDINPDYPADYTFLQNIYNEVYQNEIKAKSLTSLFSLLCLIIANLGLIIITSFVIKRKTKEIGIRKVNGATPFSIIRMLNNRFILWIGIALLIALPYAYLIMTQWLKQFAHKTEINGWLYAFAALLVLSVAMISISWQSWRAATINPIKALKTE